MTPADAPAARELILGVAARLFQSDATAVFIARHGHTLEDVDNFQRDYNPPVGLFLVALDGGRLIGTGAIRRLDDETAELRRMWLLEPYQGRVSAIASGWRCARLPCRPLTGEFV